MLRLGARAMPCVMVSERLAWLMMIGSVIEKNHFNVNLLFERAIASGVVALYVIHFSQKSTNSVDCLGYDE
jgi:hypothetical protein